MQDRFKFRTWHKPTNTMEYNGLWTGYPNIGQKMSDCNFIIMQCTGLKDKNGKLIFEGDICEYEFYDIGKQKAVIYFNKKYASYMVKPTDNFQYAKINDCEVIGNIYENPELLEDK